MVLAFGDHRLDIDGRELRRGGTLVPLEPKAFDLLAFLLRHRDHVVSKDELLQAVWGGRIVSESALTTRINAVRRAIGDDGAGQRLIRTFNRKGIRFIGEVTELAAGAGRSADETNSRDPPGASKPSLAVLPFENMTGDPEQDYFVDGVVEEIVTAIARFPWLLVIARNSSFAYKEKPVEMRRMARELGARYLLEGSVRKAGRRVRIAGQLIDTATSAHIWADRFDGVLDDIFELQDRVASSVAGAIEPRLRLTEVARAGRKPADHLDAYDLYLRAQAQANRRTREGLAESVRRARRALEIDPDYAPAMARLALSRSMQQNRHWVAPDSPEAEEGIRMARRAIAVAGDDPWVLDFSGLALALLAGDNDAALAAIDHAIFINPNFATAFGHRGLILAHLNRPDEAISAAQQAICLSPLDPAMFAFCQALALAHLTAGCYEEGLSWAEKAIRENGGVPALRLKLSLCGHLGQRGEAAECLRRLRETHADPTAAGLSRYFSKGIAPEVAACLVDGLRKAGLPDA